MRHFAAVKFVILPTCILLLSFAALAQSNSGKLVYSDEPGRIRIINADGTGDTELTAGLFIIDDDPVYSPDGSKIAFTRRGSSKSEICIMNADGTNVVSLIPGSVPPQTNDWDPSWSPDGSKLVFSSNRSGAGKAEIWMANADGTGLHRLTTSIQVSSDGQGAIFSMDLDAAWSPDGSKIAFVSTRDGLTDSELYLMNPDGTNALRLTDDALDDHMPAWSPDSQKIALAKGNGVGIVIMNRDGTNLVNIAPSSAWPAWSPDGTRLAFMQLDPNNNFNGNIFITKTDGTNKVRVTNNPSGARSASWAPSSSPAIPNFTIAGVVKDTTGLPITGATLTMFTVPVRNAQSDATGAYSFAGLPAGTYRIDIAKPGFGFVTTTVTVTIVSADQVANFTGFVAFSISGTIDGAGSGVPVTLTGSESRSTLTEGAGVYSFNFLPAGGNYTVSINSPFFIITPLSITFNNLSANQTANFSAVRAKYTISGTTRRLGLPKPGITVQLRDTTGFAPLSTTSDANGHYTFTDVIAGRAYSVELASANYSPIPKALQLLIVTRSWTLTCALRTISGSATQVLPSSKELRAYR